MIAIETVVDQSRDLTSDVFKQTTDDTYEDRADPIQELLDRLVNYSERQREKVPPDVIELSPVSGSQTTRTYTTKTRLRVIAFLITCNPTTNNIRVNVGLRPFNFYSAGYFPFPIEVPAGVDLSAANITTPDSVAFAVYVIGYTS